jgi:GGDEF domain-containing protein
MTNIEKIALKTLEVLKEKNIQPIPNEYNKEFCNIAKSQNEKIVDCDLFKKLIDKLTAPEQDELKANNIQTFEELIGLLLKRVHVQNVSTLASIIKQALSPSINIHLDEQLTNFSIKIGDSPELIFEEDIQKEMQKLLEKRFSNDQNLLKEKTADIAKLVTLMGKHLKEAINNNQNSSTNVTNIKDELVSIDLENSSITELVDLQNKLINAASSIESEMNEVNKKLSTGEDHVKDLENKVQVLESQLVEAKKEAVIDHLTGLLTRRAYDTEIKMIDKNFERENIQYAIIFFDLDHFKNINDTYGHDAGDTVLKTFSKILKSQETTNNQLHLVLSEDSPNTNKEVLNTLRSIESLLIQNNALLTQPQKEPNTDK